MALVH